MRFAALVVCGSLSFTACTSAEPSVGAQPHALGASDPTLAAPVAGAEIELDVRADGARLVGALEAPPQNGDGDRVLAATLRVPGHEEAELGRVLDARFVGEAIALVDASHALVVVRDRERVELDRGAEAPLAVRGDVIVYARGEMPFFELARLEVSRGAVSTLTDGYAPAYSPAIDADGSVVFVSSREGRPRLHRVRVDGSIEALAPTQRTPSSPRAPRLERGLLTFEDEHGAMRLDVQTGREVTP